MTTEQKFSSVGAEDPIAKLANTLASTAFEIAAGMKISKMDVCIAMANACGFILADAGKPAAPGMGGKPLPRANAIERMDGLRKVMEIAYGHRSAEFH